jgi:hypothetical protein
MVLAAGAMVMVAATGPGMATAVVAMMAWAAALGRQA